MSGNNFSRNSRNERVTPSSVRNGGGGGSVAVNMSASAPSSAVAAREQIRSVHARSKHNQRQQSEEEKRIVPRLAKRAYHLPGYGWGRDWVQYMFNNHPLLGICCHHKLHPLKFGQRLIIFIGSIASGLAITNLVFLWFTFDQEQDMNDVLFQMNILPNSTAIHSEFQSIEVTRGTAVLWTLGSMSHSMFDLTIWYISACSCCRPGGICSAFGCLRHCGSYLVVGVVMIVVALATLVVVWRAAEETRNQYEEEKEELGLGDDAYPEWGEIRGVSSFSFLVNYAVEVCLALMLYFPLFGTILFSGVLGCGRIPVLGGRPYEVRKEIARERKRLEGSSSRRSRRLQSRTSSDAFDDEIC